MDTEPPMDPSLAEAIARLRDTQPAGDLWPGIAWELAPRRPRGSLLIRWPTALAAGVAIVVATSAGTAIVLHRVRDPSSTATAIPSTGSNAVTIAATFGPGDAALAHAIDDLEQAVRASISHLDPDARASV
ncbi:MAG: hypothetical protein ACRELE_04075, partial [Gemmatimonadales bacterium]